MAQGTLIHGRYRLREMIGRGGMGEVWDARDEALDRRVAVKCLKPLGGGGEEPSLRVLRERFRREARVAAALQHRGVTVVHDFGEHEGVLYLVMELLQGRNLSELLREHRPALLEAERITDIAGQIAEALAYTHDQGIVHRDLKPANVMQLTDGTVKICDFGVARFAQDVGLSTKLTGFGMAMGTPHYMSPEQISGAGVDHRSDLYSLGCVLYEIATGAPPFDYGDPWAILVGHRDTPPEPPRARRPDLPEDLERFILALLAKDPEERPRNAVLLAQRLLAPPAPRLTAGRVPQQRPAGLLPEWTRGMRAGSRASGSWSLKLPPPDRSAGLTGPWTGLASTALARRPVGGPGPSPEYLAVLASRHSAGLSLGRLGRWQEAFDVHRAVAAARERVLGREHPDALESRYGAAVALRRLGRWQEALPAYREVAGDLARLYGADAPAVLAARYGIAIGLGRLGRADEALRLYRELVGAWTRTGGPTHPETLRARHGIGISLGRLGHWDEALAEARQVWTLRSCTLGPEHPDTLVSRREIAVALGWLGCWAEALGEYRQVRQDRERVLGADHPEALTSRNDEAHCLEQLGRPGEAVELYRQVAALREQGNARGERHGG